jgi:hypothetical protein
MAILAMPEPVRMGARTVDGIVNVQGRRLNIVIWILASISTIFLSLRLYAKVYRNRKFWWDDHFLVASFVSLPGRTSPPSDPTCRAHP